MEHLVLLFIAMSLFVAGWALDDCESPNLAGVFAGIGFTLFIIGAFME